MIVWGVGASSQGLDRERLRAIFWPLQVLVEAVKKAGRRAHGGVSYP